MTDIIYFDLISLASPVKSSLYYILLTDTTEKVFICKMYNKGTCKYEKQSQHVEKGVTYQYYCSYCYLASGKKFEHSKMKCHRLRNDNKNASVSQQV